MFTAPGYALFTDLLAGWVLTPGRRTITRMLTVADPHGRRAHDAYHRFVRAGAWDMTALWRALAVHAVAVFAPDGVVVLDCDDTVYKKTGRQVNGAGTFRDAVRSTRARVVYAWGLNLVVITLRVTPPWGGGPLGLPVNMRVHRKGGATTVALATQMIAEITDWLPERSFHLHADGAYATLVGAELPRTVVTSRLRRDAALYEPAPPRTGKRGRPRTKGERLPTPPDLAAAATDWVDAEIDERGTTVARRLWHRDVLWYRACPHRLVRLVVVRDPTGVQPDDFFVTSAPVHDPPGTGLATVTLRSTRRPEKHSARSSSGPAEARPQVVGHDRGQHPRRGRAAAQPHLHDRVEHPAVPPRRDHRRIHEPAV
ncbi:MAG: transposase, partial [Pseudonocardia sp.]|nr:transposase [Pseudonocardia sp.]